MQPDLFPYQLEGIDWLKKAPFRLLADEMGLGKSAQAIIAAKELSIQNITVVCPAIAVLTWKHEFKKWGFEPQKLEIRSYENLVANNGQIPDGTELLVCDESHYCKNPAAKRTKAIFGPQGAIRKVQRAWFLTGTPAPNNFAELWPVLRTSGQTTESYWKFAEQFCKIEHHQTHMRILGNRDEKAPVLRAMLDEVMLRRKKDRVLLSLPPIMFQEIYIEPELLSLDGVEVNEEAEQLMEALRASAPIDQMRILEGMAASVSTLRRYLGLQKVSAVSRIIVEEIANKQYEQIVVFAIHTLVISQLAERLRTAGLKVAVVTGATGKDERFKLVEDFQKGLYHVFLGNIQAAGTNITLTAANQMIMVEQSWVPAENEQAYARIHRISQNHDSVLIRLAIVSESVDEAVARVLMGKTLSLQKLFAHQESE